MSNERIRSIKQAQRESFLLREMSGYFQRILLDQPELQSLYITRVKLSSDRGKCTVFFHSGGGINDFEDKLKTLILYKPSMRSSLSKSMHSRYVPQLVFEYDLLYDKQRRVDDLLTKLKTEGKL